jgi:hypothetical protein
MARDVTASADRQEPVWELQLFVGPPRSQWMVRSASPKRLEYDRCSGPYRNVLEVRQATELTSLAKARRAWRSISL